MYYIYANPRSQSDHGDRSRGRPGKFSLGREAKGSSVFTTYSAPQNRQDPDVDRREFPALCLARYLSSTFVIRSLFRNHPSTPRISAGSRAHFRDLQVEMLVFPHTTALPVRNDGVMAFALLRSYIANGWWNMPCCWWWGLILGFCILLGIIIWRGCWKYRRHGSHRTRHTPINSIIIVCSSGKICKKECDDILSFSRLVAASKLRLKQEYRNQYLQSIHNPLQSFSSI